MNVREVVVRNSVDDSRVFDGEEGTDVRVAAGDAPGLIPAQGSVERKHALQFACVKSKCLRARRIAREDPKRLGS